MDYIVETRQQAWGDFEQKWAEASGTAVMPNQGPGTSTPPASKVIPKTGSVNPRVDVSNAEAPRATQEKTAQHYALPSNQRYPLDSYADVEKAASYFDEWQVRMSPGHRHEYCTNLVKRASVLGIKVGDTIQRYGSSTYAPAQQIKIAFDGRRTLLQDEAQIDLLDKLAESYVAVSPDVFAEALSEFDKLAGLDTYYGSDIPDPFYSVFGLTKVADSLIGDSGNKSFIVGNDYVNNEQLNLLGRTDMISLQDYFGEEFTKEFRKDPVGIFSSLPAEQKKIVARLANDADPGY